MASPRLAGDLVNGVADLAADAEGLMAGRLLAAAHGILFESSICWSCLLLSGGLVGPVNLDIVPDWRRLGEQSVVFLGGEA